MPTGLSIRQRLRAYGLCVLGQTDGAGAAGYLTDATRLKMPTLPVDTYGEAFVRVTTGVVSTTQGGGNLPTATTVGDATLAMTVNQYIGAIISCNGVTAVVTANAANQFTFAAGWSGATPGSGLAYTVTWAYVGKVKYLDPVNGRLYVEPDMVADVGSGQNYEVWLNGVRPDDVDRAAGIGQVELCSDWQLKPMSVLSPVESWTAQTNAALAVNTLDYPSEYFAQSLQVTNTNANGAAQSETVRVRPNQQMVIFGFASMRSGAVGQIRFRDITNGVDVAPLVQPAVLQYDGWVYFQATVQVPATCGQAQLWLGATANGAVSEWTGAGMLPAGGRNLTMPSRVRNTQEVGRFYRMDGAGLEADWAVQVEIVGVKRKNTGDGARVILPPAWPGGGVYYDEAIHYAALQAGYVTKAQRAIGENAVTACPERYAAVAAAAELLSSMARTPALDALYTQKVLPEFNTYDYWDGAAPDAIDEPRVQYSIPYTRL